MTERFARAKLAPIAAFSLTLARQFEGMEQRVSFEMAWRRSRLLFLVAVAALVGGSAVTYFRDRSGADAVAMGDEGLTAAIQAAPIVARGEIAAGKQALVSVKRAFVYGGFKKWLELGPEDHLVAVEVSVHPDSPALDLDDIDFLDARTQESYGSFPVVLTRTKDGVLTEDLARADDEGALLVIIHALPRTVDLVQLKYWGSNLGEPVRIER